MRLGMYLDYMFSTESEQQKENLKRTGAGSAGASRTLAMIDPKFQRDLL